MIEARGLSKRYGDKVAVDDLSFTVRPGRVTGFLGPNGAGKFAVFSGYAAVLLALGAWLFIRRDA
jgi:ABC-type multidrug transport system ATPase subunit